MEYPKETIPNIEVGYMVSYKGEEYIADTYEDIINYIVQNFPPNSYDIYYLDEKGSKNFYASFNFQETDKERFR